MVFYQLFNSIIQLKISNCNTFFEKTIIYLYFPLIFFCEQHRILYKVEYKKSSHWRDCFSISLLSGAPNHKFIRLTTFVYLIINSANLIVKPLDIDKKGVYGENIGNLPYRYVKVCEQETSSTYLFLCLQSSRRSIDCTSSLGKQERAV